MEKRWNTSEVTSLVSSKSFAEDVSEKIGISPRRIQQKIQIARDLQPEVKEIVRENRIGSEDTTNFGGNSDNIQWIATDTVSIATIK